MISKDTNIYLDIDGTILHEDLERYNQPAAHLYDFLDVLKDYPVYWLTTHCKDGNLNTPQKHLQKLLPQELFQYVLEYKPTVWNVKKTEGIDFRKPFLWFENDVTQDELDVLEKAGKTDSLVRVDLINNQNHLTDIVQNIFHTLK